MPAHYRPAHRVTIFRQSPRPQQIRAETPPSDQAFRLHIPPTQSKNPMIGPSTPPLRALIRYHHKFLLPRKWRQIPDVKKRLSNELAAKKYGITVDQVLELRSFPSCQCCGAGLRDDPNHKHIDHCHDSGDVRGIVCRACNLTLQGTHDECVMRLKSCLAYLERHRFKALA